MFIIIVNKDELVYCRFTVGREGIMFRIDTLKSYRAAEMWE